MAFKIIGLSGTNGSGKDTVGHVLALKHNYLFVSVTDLLREEAKKRGLAIERESLRLISADWRRKYGYGVLVDQAYHLYQELDEKYSGLAISSLRNPHEADRVHELGGIVVWVDASPRTRYERIQRNLANRDRSSEDSKTFEEFLVEEEMEMHTPPGGDEASLNMAGVKVRSDMIINNEGTDLAEFEEFIEQQLFGSSMNEKASPPSAAASQMEAPAPGSPAQPPTNPVPAQQPPTAPPQAAEPSATIPVSPAVQPQISPAQSPPVQVTAPTIQSTTAASSAPVAVTPAAPMVKPVDHAQALKPPQPPAPSSVIQPTQPAPPDSSSSE